MAGDSVGIIASFRVKSGAVDRVRSMIRKNLVEPTRAEEGCLRYDLWQDPDEPTSFVMVEEWASAEHLQQHLTQPHVEKTVEALRPDAEGDVRVRRYVPVA